MDCGHESLCHIKVVMDDFGQKGQELGSAKEISDNLEIVVIFLMVHAHSKCGVSAEGAERITIFLP